MAYAVNTENVVHDTIDGEVLAIRSDTGTYYSMQGSAGCPHLEINEGRCRGARIDWGHLARDGQVRPYRSS